MKTLIFAAFLTCASLVQAQPYDLDTATPQAVIHEEAQKPSLMSWLGLQSPQFSANSSDIVFTALGKLGTPYRLGGSSLTSGFDCSGLVYAVFKQSLGLALPRQSADQARHTQKINQSDLKPGDLVFFNTRRRSFSHVGIYIGDDKFVHAPRAGASVRIESMNLKYWKNRFDGARRVALRSDEVSF